MKVFRKMERTKVIDGSSYKTPKRIQNPTDVNGS